MLQLCVVFVLHVPYVSDYAGGGGGGAPGIPSNLGRGVCVWGGGGGDILASPEASHFSLHSHELNH